MAYLRATGGCITSAQREPVPRKRAIWGKLQDGASASGVILGRGKPWEARSKWTQPPAGGARQTEWGRPDDLSPRLHPSPGLLT